jgi:hypothetical protein
MWWVVREDGRIRKLPRRGIRQLVMVWSRKIRYRTYNGSAIVGRVKTVIYSFSRRDGNDEAVFWNGRIDVTTHPDNLV